MEIAVDTSLAIDIMKGKPHAVSFLKRHENYTIALPSIVRFELMRGAKTEREKFIISLFDVLPFDERCADIAAGIWTELKRRGSQPAMADLLIAATCIAHNVPLATRDSDFKIFTEFGLELVQI